eukprot:812672-Amorphochlora_amoeboformis.AAC.2
MNAVDRGENQRVLWRREGARWGLRRRRGLDAIGFRLWPRSTRKCTADVRDLGVFMIFSGLKFDDFT